MRKLMIVVSSCALISAAYLPFGVVHAAEAQKMDESTNANTNPDVKTQNLQQKPNHHDAESTSTNSSSKSKTHHDRKSNVEQANDEMNGTKGSSDIEKMRQKPN